MTNQQQNSQLPELDDGHVLRSVQQAYYNAAAIAFVVLIGLAIYNNLVIFSSCLKSLMWASLCGVFLNDLKRWIVHSADRFLRQVEASENSFLLFSVLLLPWRGVCSLYSSNSDRAAKTMYDLFCFLQSKVSFSAVFVGVMTTFVVAAGGIGTALLVIKTRVTTFIFTYVALGNSSSWIVASIGAWISFIFPPPFLRKLADGHIGWLLLVLLWLAFPLPVMFLNLGELLSIAICVAVISLVAIGALTDHSYTAFRASLHAKIPQAHIRNKHQSSSAFYFYLLYIGLACVIVQQFYVFMHAWILFYVLPWILLSFVCFCILTGIKLVKIFAESKEEKVLQPAGKRIRPSSTKKRSKQIQFLLSAHPQTLAILCFKGCIKIDKLVIAKLRQNINMIITCVIILLSLVLAIGFVIFFSIQIHNEASVAVSASQTLWYEKVSGNVELQRWVNETILENEPVMTAVEETTTKAVSAVRVWTDSYLKTILGNDFNISVVEQAVRQTWYTMNEAEGTWSFSLLYQQITTIMRKFKTLNWSWFASWFSDGVELLKIAVFRVPKTTMYIIGSFLKSLFDFFFSIVVFVSSLYIFLSSEEYQPLELFTSFFPGRVRQNVKRLMEDTIKDVFVSSFKMAVFHALLTWCTFQALGMRFVYMPMLVSAILAVVPVVPTFTLSLMFSCHLYLFEDRASAALCLLSIHIATYWFVDPTILSEIKISSPYITALSIVGGLAAFGLDGVLIGPILVSLLMIGRNLLILFLEEDEKPGSYSSPPARARQHSKIKRKRATSSNNLMAQSVTSVTSTTAGEELHG